MRRMALLLLTFASTSFAALAQEGEAMTGNEMLPACRAVATMESAAAFDDPFTAGFCAGMILMLPSTGRICSPDKATIQQGAKVLVKFFDDHPQALSLPASILAKRAFEVAWPCPKTK
jgi:hypothetical protein